VCIIPVTGHFINALHHIAAEVVYDLQGLLTYAQLASILGMLNVQWPSILQGLFKGFSWITHIAPKVSSMHTLLLLMPLLILNPVAVSHARNEAFVPSMKGLACSEHTKVDVAAYFNELLSHATPRFPLNFTNAFVHLGH